MFKNILMIAVMAFSYGAFAKDIKVMGEKHSQGQEVLHLRTLANKALKNQNLRNFELVGVTMKAKSLHGNGKATLVVGNDQSQKNVDQFGDAIFFLVEAPWAYHTLRWNISSMPGQANEIWQIHLRGNIKIEEVKLKLRPRSNLTRVRIPMRGELLAGENTIKLRQELKKMGYQTRRDQLRRVVMVAKSRRGRASAGMQVGQNFSNAQTIGQSQNGLAFQSNLPKSYNRLAWNFRGRTPGAWQLHMKGRIKVKAVIVEFQE